MRTPLKKVYSKPLWGFCSGRSKRQPERREAGKENNKQRIRLLLVSRTVAGGYCKLIRNVEDGEGAKKGNSAARLLNRGRLGGRNGKEKTVL